MSEHHVDYMNRKGGHSVIMQGGTFSPMCTSDSMDSCMAPGFWQTMISTAKVRKRYYSEIESCKSKPIDHKFQLFCMATWHSRWSSDYRVKHGLKFDKRTIYIVYFLSHVHVHIEKMGNLSKSKIKLYICDNKLRSCAQFAPRCKSAPGC